MTEEARKIVKALRNNIRDGFYWIGNAGFSMPCIGMINLIESLSTQLEQVTRERNALLDELKGECDVCANRKDCTAPKCRKSPHKECEECPCRTCIIDTNWKWEGVEVTNDAQKGSDAKS